MKRIAFFATAALLCIGVQAHAQATKSDSSKKTSKPAATATAKPAHTKAKAPAAAKTDAKTEAKADAKPAGTKPAKTGRKVHKAAVKKDTTAKKP